MRRRPNPLFLALLAVIGLVELVFFAANAAKFADGGWFPLACGLALFVMLTTWKTAQTVLAAHAAGRRVPVEDFPKLFGPEVPRVPGTAVYLSADPDSVPTVLMHNLKHNKVLHERVVFLTIVDADVPRVPNLERAELNVIVPGSVYQATLHYGFMESPDVPKGLALFKRLALDGRTRTGHVLSRQIHHRARGEAGAVHLAPGIVPLDAAQQPRRRRILQAAARARGGARHPHQPLGCRYLSSRCFLSLVFAHSSASGGPGLRSMIGVQPLASSAFSAMNSRWESGTSSSAKIASTGHSATHKVQSMHSSGSMTSMFGPSRKQSTGQTSTQSVYLHLMQVSVTT